jgi:hypothetical protein
MDCVIFGCNPSPRPPSPKPPKVIEPVDWIKCGCEKHLEAMACWSETPVFAICSHDCETIDWVVPLRATLGSTTATVDEIYRTEVIENYRSLVIRKDEWLKHPELGECPTRGLVFWVECTKEFVCVLPNDGLPVFEPGDQYGKSFRIHGKCSKPCFEFDPQNWQ